MDRRAARSLPRRGGWTNGARPSKSRPPSLEPLFGVGSAVAHLFLDEPQGQETEAVGDPGDLNVFESASGAVSPAWVNFTNPVLGAVGVLIGARLRRRRSAEAPPA